MLELKRRVTIDWTDDLVKVLKRMWRNGATASEIALQLGGGISRSAVIGKVHRLNLPKRAKPVSVAKTDGMAAPTVQKSRLHQIDMAGEAPGLAEDDGVDVTELVGTVSILELDHRACKFPIGDPQSPDFGFCGKERLPGRPYCSDHCHRAYIGFQP
ncbi:GcrA cell cycle regulator [Devosia sp. H5989]|nr:GcrA cell cycle regulator [Devosia sp. H5989]